MISVTKSAGNYEKGVDADLVYWVPTSETEAEVHIDVREAEGDIVQIIKI